jgi:hypothetical protein
VAEARPERRQERQDVPVLPGRQVGAGIGDSLREARPKCGGGARGGIGVDGGDLV